MDALPFVPILLKIFRRRSDTFLIQTQAADGTPPILTLDSSTQSRSNVTLIVGLEATWRFFFFGESYGRSVVLLFSLFRQNAPVILRFGFFLLLEIFGEGMERMAEVATVFC